MINSPIIQSGNYSRVDKIIAAQPIDMGGFRVKQALPSGDTNQVDPFLLLHHAETVFNKDSKALHQGVGPHPHRGFSPVTFVIEGEVHHRDSRGNDQIARSGEVQWMNTGAGIIHSERPSEAIVENGDRQEIVQLWINVPANKKMLPPQYQFLTNSGTPTFRSTDQRIVNKLIAGTYGDLKNPVIETYSKMLIIWGKGEREGMQIIQLPTGYNRILYLIKGEMKLNEEQRIKGENLVVFHNSGTHIHMECIQESQFLLLCGQPIRETVTQYGPFVMNTQTEILEAMRDYQMGKMGVLIEQ